MAQQSGETGHSKESESQNMTDAELKAAQNVGNTATRKELDEDIDSILDEIDDVLETNAEDFVKSFIQKGGQ